MRSTWDTRKNQANLPKHGTSFEGSQNGVSRKSGFEEVDDREDNAEERIKATGRTDHVVVVISQDRPGGERRIISARRTRRCSMKSSGRIARLLRPDKKIPMTARLD